MSHFLTPIEIEAVAGQAYITLSGNSAIYSGSGSPEGALSAPAGSQYINSDNGDLYKKASGAGPTGWVLLGDGGGGGGSNVQVTYIDPVSPATSGSQALPPSPDDEDVVEYIFGGNVSFGNLVYGSFSFTGGTVAGSPVGSICSGDVITLRYRNSSSTWNII